MAAPSKTDKRVDDNPSSDSESDDSRDDEGWNDVEEDEEEVPEVISLLDDRVFPDVMSMLAHCKDKHNFDFLGMRQRLQLDFHGCVKLVNFIRQRVHEGLAVDENISRADIENDAYLKPVLDDDAVIIGLFDLPELPAPEATLTAQSGDNAALVNDLLKRNAELQEQLASVMRQHDNYRAAVSKTLDERWGEAGVDDGADKGGKGKAADGAEEKEDESKYYWESYAGVDIHETMLKDTVRTEAYRDFIYQNKDLFAGKTVLDIGCGTGILSMFCARAGAARVIAVDASDIIVKARENIYRAGLSDTIMTLHGKMEEVALPVEQVDVIVSEWMGYCLLFEAMLPSVLYARDKYLAPGGLMVPSHTNMWVAPVSDPAWVAENGEGFWSDVYGFDMAAMARGLYDDVRVLHWPADRICGRPHAFRMLDLYRVTAADLSFTAPYASSLTHDLVDSDDDVDGFLIWFDTFFSPVALPRVTATTSNSEGQQETASNGGEHAVPDDAVAIDWVLDSKGKRDQRRVAFTTGPYSGAEGETHWKQGLLFCNPHIGEDKKAGDKDEESKKTRTRRSKDDVVSGEITFAVDKDYSRALSIKATWGWEGDEASGKSKKEQSWALK